MPGSYPRYPVESLKDNDDKPEGAWRSRDLALSRMESTGAWISFEVEPEVEVNCVRVMPSPATQETRVQLKAGEKCVRHHLG